ncbi:hypothetical protein MVEN_01406000 [Mycena venus]|uniref:MFS general substrate transporter n=1 Tax=Mycena venus TaxID=2733690 RepID=A0A8H6XYT9_9AGAR|nr:hypothetical protein MVEN_01406000 [Mycena venus]
MQTPPTLTPLGEPESTPRTQTPDTLASHVPRPDVPKALLAPTPIFPEGGLRAWATVAGAVIVQFCGFGYITSYGVYQDFYTRDYLTQSSSSAISWIGSISAFILISGGLVSGRLFDRGHFYLLLCGGSFLQCFSLFMLSLCGREQYYQIFLAQGLGLGIGAGTVYIPSIAIVSHYFQKRRALAMTIVASGSSLGAVIHPIMLNNTFHSLGFANAVRASAGLVSGLLLISCLLMRTRYPPTTPHIPFWKSLPRFARDKPYVYAVIGMATYTIGFYFPLFYLQLDAITHGINKTLSFYSLVIMNAASFVGRLSPGFFAHRFGVPEMVAASGGVGAVLILCMIALKSVASVVVLGVLYGYSAGIFVTLMAPIFSVLTDDVGELGQVYLKADISYILIISRTASEWVSASAWSLSEDSLDHQLTAPYSPATSYGGVRRCSAGLMASVGFVSFLATVVAVRNKKKTLAVRNENEKGKA